MTISNMYNKISYLLILFILSMISFSIIYITNDSYSVENQNTTRNNFNIIATADIGCSLRAQENIKNIEKLQPELFLAAGDLSYKKTPDCWFNMTKSLDSKTKIAIGNHDDFEEEGVKGETLKQSFLDHYNLDKSYYSFDYQNVHVLVLDTQLELSVDTLESTAIVNETTTATTADSTIENKDKKNEKEESKNENKKNEPLLERFPLIDLDDFLKQKSIDIEIPQLDKFLQTNAKVPSIDIDEEQYQFVLDDLEKASKNKDIDWIFVMFHKPMYSPLSKQFEEYIIRDKYQDVFDKYSIDLVIQGHNHIYSRTLPLSLNKLDISQPIIDSNSITNNNTVFTNPNGTIFLVVGVGGAELHRITEKQYYIANQYNEGFGFVDLNIDGKRLDGVFYDISLNCKMEITEKKKKEVMDLESCLPSTTNNNNNNNLKIIDRFTIIK
jgi:3',5'-cyclic AMP phosphodiesterase CpdA